MNRQVILVTGAAGFLGSAITVDLCRDCKLVAIDRREPTGDLLRCTPDARWSQVDIADGDSLGLVFDRTMESFGRIDYVLHFAAFYHFGTDWRPEYERTNLQGTANVLRCAIHSGAKRLLFASSIAAMLPPPPGQMLTENTATADYIPYARSKSLGEKMVREAAARLPGIVLRIGGVFSDWAELPPLSSLIRLWTGRSLLSRLVPGRGATGMPYIHRNDLVRFVRRCIERQEELAPHEVFLACQHGAVLHRELFPAIHQSAGDVPTPQPIFIAAGLAKAGLYMKHLLGCFTGNKPCERPWMLQYVDRPWVADATYTQSTLGWNCAEGMTVLDRLPIILAHFRRYRRKWEHCNAMRNKGDYRYNCADS